MCNIGNQRCESATQLGCPNATRETSGHAGRTTRHHVSPVHDGRPTATGPTNKTPPTIQGGDILDCLSASEINQMIAEPLGKHFVSADLIWKVSANRIQATMAANLLRRQAVTRETKRTVDVHNPHERHKQMGTL